MAVKTILNYSPNFNSKKRLKNQIKFIIFHYTGMKSEKSAINRLTNIQSEVAAHYLIKNNGEVISLVPNLYVAWHAGVSSWKKLNFLNRYSIGIEISNPGHQFGYKNFSKKQIKSLIRLSKELIKKYKINAKNILGHSDIAPDRKKDPGEKFPWEKLAKNKVGLWHNINKKILINLRGQKTQKKNIKIFLRNIFKIGYSKKGKKKIKKEKYEILVIKAFQRRFRKELINGKIDKECLLISNIIAKLM